MSIFMLKPSTALNLESCKAHAGARSGVNVVSSKS